MKKKIVTALVALFLFFSIGAAIAVVYITNTTDEVKRIVQLHQVEQLRRSLLINIQAVQANLHTINTPYAADLDAIIENVAYLEESAGQCTACHHAPRLNSRIVKVQSLIDDYAEDISFFMTLSANSTRIEKLKNKAVAVGARIIAETEQMSHSASNNLIAETTDVMDNIYHIREILGLTLAVTLILGVIVAVQLIRSVTRPVRALVDATRKIASGEYGTTITYDDNTEFGELAHNFNTMSTVVKKGYEEIQAEIEERKQVEGALESSEKFLNTIFGSILDPFCIIDKNFRIIKVNDAYSEIKDRADTDLIGCKCYEVFEGRDSVCGDCIIEKTFQSTDPCAKDKSIEMADGTRVWLEMYTYPIFDEEGNVTHVVEYVRDITDRRRAEEAVKESEERYALAARGANDGLWDWNLKENSIFYSPRWKSILGHDNEEISSSPEEWISRIHPDDRNKVEAEMSAHIGGHTPKFRNEHRIRHRDGTFRWVLNRGLVIRDDSGSAHRMAGSMTDITERKMAEEQLLFDALHDELTRLPNRALFMDRLGQAVSREVRHNKYLFAVCFLDIDRFKILNDSLGHTVGDKLLIEISEKLVDGLRPDDTVARLGGDEFAILLEDLKDKNEAIQVLERIHEKLSFPFNLEGQEVFTTASIGITFSGAGYDNPENLLRDADIAMYHAKSRNGASYQVFDNNMYDNAVARMQLETDLRQAVSQNEFCLNYQPIVSVNNRRISGLEALVRWQHPRRGLMSPDSFIPAAEETGMILPLGEWILSEACRQLSTWQKKFPAEKALTMSVNISSKQLSDELISYVKKVMNDTAIVPGSLILEITESMIMENAEKVAPLLLKMKDMNVQLHIDDFGTGYSSLSYLHKFPVDVLKIDRSFVNRIGDHGENLEIIKAITTLAQSLDMNVIAEGVETSHQISQLKTLECDHMQGFFFSRPLEASEVEKLLKKSHTELMTFLSPPSSNREGKR